MTSVLPLFKRMTRLLPLLALLLLGGCQQAADDTSASQAAAQAQAEARSEKDRSGNDPSAAAFQVVGEVYGDAAIFAQPRIQFLWRSPVESQDHKEVWSINLDGSDLRRAVSFRLINGYTRYAVRSPDNRYIVMAVSANDRYEKRLVDLQTMTVKTFSWGGNKPAFRWGRHSDRVYFNENGEFKQFDLVSGAVKILTRFGDGGDNFLLFDQDRKIVLFNTGNYTINRMSDGKELRRVEVRGIGSNRVALSPDQRYIAFEQYGGKVHSLEDPAERYDLLGDTNPFFFSPLEQGKIFFGLGGRKSFLTGELDRDDFYWLPEGGGNSGGLTLFNLRAFAGAGS